MNALFSSGKLRLALASGLVLAVAAALAFTVHAAAAGDPQHGGKVAAEKCASCHGPDGNGGAAATPKLAGQKAAYLYRELWAFKRGGRPSAVMHAVVAPLSDADLADAAAYYADRRVRPDAVSDPALAQAGERIYYAGRPSCAMCHDGGGMSMMGMMGGGMAPNAPRLRGQHAGYTLRQLDAFASGRRRGTVMNRVAPALTETERRAVAVYLSGTH